MNWGSLLIAFLFLLKLIIFISFFLCYLVRGQIFFFFGENTTSASQTEMHLYYFIFCSLLSDLPYDCLELRHSCACFFFKWFRILCFSFPMNRHYVTALKFRCTICDSFLPISFSPPFPTVRPVSLFLWWWHWIDGTMLRKMRLSLVL